METTGPPRFLGNPSLRAVLSDPGDWWLPSLYFHEVGVADESFFRGSIARPACSLSTLRGTSHLVAARKTRFRQ